jgi:hypothetical protein
MLMPGEVGHLRGASGAAQSILEASPAKAFGTAPITIWISDFSAM